MIRFLVVLLFGLPICAVADDNDTEEFVQVIETIVEHAPLTIAYHYTFIQSDFQQDTTGTLILLAPNVFRITFWDKVYGSDGTSVYVHDRNTKQTIIDSLKWTELPPWLQILNGEVPHSINIARLPSEGELPKWSLAHHRKGWICSVTIDTLANRLTEIKLHEGDLAHILLLDAPLSYPNSGWIELVTLKDLPGVRLDLR